MDFEDRFDELDRMLLSKTTDHEKMRAALREMRASREIARFMGPAQDRLYASIARGHRKVLEHLEAGETAAAAHTAAKAIAWFYVRFQGIDPTTTPKNPEIANELREVQELAGRSEVLRKALGNPTAGEIHDV
jgi:hypothetical protein